MTTTPNMLLVLPTDHGSADTWDVILDTLFGLVDGHDHSTGKGVKVPVAGLNINADLSFSPSGTPRAITDLKSIDFAPVASTAVTLLAGAFFISDGTGGLVANELYFRTTSGSNVRFTLGAALNVAAFAGGIGGDYSAVSALLDYDDATDTYRLRQETAAAVRQFAKLSCADLRLTEYKASGVTPVPPAAVTIKSPAALAGSYSVTMPAALPGSTQLVQMDSSGVLTASNTVSNALTFSAALTVNNTITTNNTVTTTSTVVATGSDLTSNAHRVRIKAPAALAADYDVTMPGALPSATQVMRMSSAGVVTAAAGTETRTFSAAFGVISANAIASGMTRASGSTTGGGFININAAGGASNPVWLPLAVSVGEIITAWSIRAIKTSAAGTITAQLVESDGSAADANIGTAATNSAVTPGAILMFKAALSATVANDKSYHIVVNGGGTTGDAILQYQVTVTVSP